MGKRGEESPRSKSAPAAAKFDLPKETTLKEETSPKSEGASVRSKSPIKRRRKSLNCKVIINLECRKLADQALFKKSSSEEEKELSKDISETVSAQNVKIKSPKKKNISPVPRRIHAGRRKALTQALKQLRNRPDPRSGCKHLQLKSSRERERLIKKNKREVDLVHTHSHSLRSTSPRSRLRPRSQQLSPALSPEKKTSNIRARRVSSPRKSKDKMHSPTPSSSTSSSHKPETIKPKEPMFPENNVVQENDVTAESKDKDKSKEQSSDSSLDDLQIPILDKPTPLPALPLEREEEEDSDDDFLIVPEDSDDESSLLSPSALPVSSPFESIPEKMGESEKSKARSSTLSQMFPGKSSYPLKTSTPFKLRSPPPRKLSELALSYTMKMQSMSTSSDDRLDLTSPPVPMEKRGRGRPRKTLDDVKSNSGKICRRQLSESLSSIMGSSSSQNQNHNYNDEENLLSPLVHYKFSASTLFPHSTGLPDFSNIKINLPSCSRYSLDSQQQSLSSGQNTDTDPQNQNHRKRWKDRSTFVYAKHKFVESKANKYRCETCEVNFTALSSLKRHYGTIYHKQRLAQVGAPPPADPNPSVSPTFSGSPSQSLSRLVGGTSSNPAEGKRFPRTTKNAADNIKKYYAAVDKARRNKSSTVVSNPSSSSSSSVGGSNGSWRQQKHQRRRKPVQHHDFLYPSSSADSEPEGEEERFNEFLGGEGERPPDANDGEDNIENNFPTDLEDYDLRSNGENHMEPWLSNEWKGFGPPHFTCEVCGFEFENKFEFTKHLFEHRQSEEKVQSLTCPDCQKNFPNESVLTNHFKLFNHGPNQSNQWKKMKRFNCSQCGSAFSQKEYYRKHVETHKRPKLRCEHCPEVFDFKFYLSDHMKLKHDNVLSNNNGGGATLLGGELALEMGESSKNIPNNNSSSVPPSSSLPPPSSTVTSAMVMNKNKPSMKKCELVSKTTTFLPPDYDFGSGGKRNKRRSSATLENDRKRKREGGKESKNSLEYTSLSSSTASNDVDREYADGVYDMIHDEAEVRVRGQVKKRPSIGITTVEEMLLDERDADSLLEHLENTEAGSLSQSQEVKENEKEEVSEGLKEGENKDQSEAIEDTDLVEIQEGNEERNKAPSPQPSSSGISTLDRSSTEDGRIVFQFDNPISSENSSVFDKLPLKEIDVGVDEETPPVSTVFPITFEISKDKICANDHQVEKKKEGKIPDPDEDSQESNKIKVTIAENGQDMSAIRTEVRGQAEERANVGTTEEAEEESVFMEEDPAEDHQNFTGVGGGSAAAPNVSKLPLPSSSNSSLTNLPLIGCGVKWAVKTKPDEDPLVCQDCGKIFEHRKSLVKHVHYYRQNIDFPCQLCNKVFKLKHHVSRHLKSFHNVDLSSTASSSTSEDQGEADFLHSPVGSGSSGLVPIPLSLSEVAVGSHVFASSSQSFGAGPSTGRSSSGSKGGKVGQPLTSISSQVPGKSYTTVNDDNGTPVFKCLVCYKLYPTKPQLNSHLWYHNKRNAAAARSETRRRSASTSSRTASTSNSSNSVPRPGTSAGRGKFPCDICPDKCFTWRKDLLRHRREKHGIFNRRPGTGGEETTVEVVVQPPSPKRCSYCPLVFPAENDLKQHILQEHKERKHQDNVQDTNEQNEEGDEYDDMPPTPSPHTSPIPIIDRHDNIDPVDEEDVEEEEEDDEQPDSPEFELLELN